MADSKISDASPGLKTGRGLKLIRLEELREHVHASPGLKTGRGLKPIDGEQNNVAEKHRPA